MTGLKTNERPGTRAVAKYVRVSPTKARAVLDLIRGESYGRASEILAFSERAVSEVVGKCLDSAVANAENNDGIPAEELHVSACYADEGPTMKRWRPRARGRATSINKRTCHITIIVSRYDEVTLEILREREASSGRVGSSAHAAESRSQRVQRSRAAAEEAAHDHDHVDDDVAPVVAESADAAEDAAETAETAETAEDAAVENDADESADDAEKEAT